MLARCPFCGSDDVRLQVYDFAKVVILDELKLRLSYQCECRDCRASGPVCGDRTEAEHKWAEMPYLAGRVPEMRLFHLITPYVFGDLETTYLEDEGYVVRADLSDVISKARG
jgi:hypothetical protein